MEPVWAARNSYIARFVTAGDRVVDWGCGDRSVLNYITVADYLGIDRVEGADIVCDFDLSLPSVEGYDLALVLGVLEYVADPGSLLAAAGASARRAVVLAFNTDTPKTHHGWLRCYQQASLAAALRPYWSTVTVESWDRYVIGICSR